MKGGVAGVEPWLPVREILRWGFHGAASAAASQSDGCSPRVLASVLWVGAMVPPTLDKGNEVSRDSDSAEVSEPVNGGSWNGTQSRWRSSLVPKAPTAQQSSCYKLLLCARGYEKVRLFSPGEEVLTSLSWHFLWLVLGINCCCDYSD